jgi:hypothetical protein
MRQFASLIFAGSMLRKSSASAISVSFNRASTFHRTFTTIGSSNSGRVGRTSAPGFKPEFAQVPGNQMRFAAFDVCEASEAVVFQFEKKVWVIERFADEAKAHWLDAG